MTQLYYPLHSLRAGQWFKLICGASYQYLPAVRNLTLAYTLAGADCIDVAADPAVIAAAKEALEIAPQLKGEAQARGFAGGNRPWLMVSLNDGEDPHFRKAEFDPKLCPAECPRPCEKICPAQAIVFDNTPMEKMGRWRNRESESSLAPDGVRYSRSGVIEQRCYGCGRCVPICPSQLIYTRSYVSAPTAIAPLVLSPGIDALEIHTQVGNLADFQRLWSAIAPGINQLKLLAISCPDGENLIDYLWAINELITPLPCILVWQTDGRPMSGDIGIGATRAAVKLAQKVLAAGLPGYVQLAGGTNYYTVSKLKATGLLQESGEQKMERNSLPHPLPYIAGIAYGSYARVLLSGILDQLEQFAQEKISADLKSDHRTTPGNLEQYPDLLWQAVDIAHSLVCQLKSSPKLLQSLPN